MRKIVILGGAGDGEVVAGTIAAMHGAREDGWELVGFLNDSIAAGNTINKVPILGKLEAWINLPRDVYFFAALHKVRQMRTRAERIDSLGIPRQRWGNVIDPAARVTKKSLIGTGIFLGPNVVVQAGACIGSHVSIRAGANIGHDVIVGDFCYIGPNSTLCGRSTMYTGSHLGPNACVADGVELGKYSVVGICSAVTKHVPEDYLVFGVPARKVFAA